VEKDGRVVEETIKLKGIRQTFEASQQLTVSNFGGLAKQKRVDLYSDDSDVDSDDGYELGRVITVDQHTINRNFAKKMLRSHDMKKKLSFVSNKRYFPSFEMWSSVYPDDPTNRFLRTLPWGYGRAK